MTATIALQSNAIIGSEAIGSAKDHPDPAAASTRQITSAIAAGDTAVFAFFYERWFDRCLSTAHRLTRRDESFCLDVVQDAMLRVIRSMRTIDDAAHLERWMTRTVHTTALDHLRAEQRRIRRERRHARLRPADREDDAQSRELRERIEWLRSEISGLDERDRALIQARFGRSASLRGAGAAAGVSDGAAHGRIRRTLDRLRRLAREEGHD